MGLGFRSMWLPTLEFSLWPCIALLVFFIPVSLWHERAWRRTLGEYAQLRTEAGASDAAWPSHSLRRRLGTQPWLLLAATTPLAAMTALGLAALLAWPKGLPGFDQPLNYFDRPYLAAVSVAAIAAIVAVLAVVVDLFSSPWARVASNVRRAVHARPAEREKRLAAALEADPDVAEARARAAAADAATRDEAASADAPAAPAADADPDERPAS